MTSAPPIVTFHGIGPPSPALVPGEADYWITETQFLRFLDVIATLGGAELTFDDGNRSDADIVLPVLRSRRLHATFFVLAGRLTNPHFLSPSDLRALRDAGMAVGLHGMHHRPWRRMSAAFAHEEIIEARAVLEDCLGVPVEEAACPFGSYGRSVLALLRQSGIRRVLTSDGGGNRNSGWLMARRSLRATDTPASVRAMLMRDLQGPTLVRRATTRIKQWT